MTTSESSELSRDHRDVQRVAQVPLRDVALTALIIVFLTILPPTYLLSGRIGLAAVLLGLAIWWSFNRVRSPLPESWPNAVPAWLILAGLILPVFAAASPRLGLEHLLVPLAGLGLYAFFSSGVLSRDAILLGIAVAGAALAVLTLVDFVAQTLAWMDVMSVVNPSAGLFDVLPLSPPTAAANPGLHPNATAAIFGMALCASMTVARLPGKTPLAWFTGTCAGLGLMATGSRGAIVAGIVGTAVPWVMLADGSESQRRTRVRTLLIGSSLGLATVVGLSAAGFKPEFIFRSTFIDRLPVMRLGLEMFADSPVVGHGPGAFPYLYPLYGPDLYPGVDARVVWLHPHSGYVQSLLEFGVLGTTLVAIGMGFLVVSMVKTLRSPNSDNRLGAVAGLGVLLVFGLHSLIEPLYIYLAPVVFVATATAAGTLASWRVRHGFNLMGWLTLLPLILIVPVVVALTVQSHLVYLRGRDALIAGQVDVAIDQIDSAATSDGLPIYLLALNAAETQDNRRPTPVATSALNPYLTGSFFLNQARAALADGDDSTARQHLVVAYPLIRGDETALVDYGFLSIEVGSEADATAGFTEAIAINPWLATSPFLDQVPEDMRSAVLDRAFEVNPCWYGDEWVLAGAGTEERLERLHSQCDPLEPARLMAMVATGTATEALRLATNELNERPDSLDLRRVAGMAALTLGDIDQARWHLAIGSLLGDPYSVHALASTYPVGEVPSPIRMLMDGLSDGHSPVLLDARPRSIYLFAGVIANHAGRREALLTPLADGLWEDAFTLLHADLSAGDRN